MAEGSRENTTVTGAAQFISEDALRHALDSFNIETSTEFNSDKLQALVDMGFSENASKRALYYTRETGVEEAIEWLEVNADIPELDAPFVPLMTSHSLLPSFSGSNVGAVVENEDIEPDLKMVFVVNTELKMGVGKIAAQVGHAVLGLYCALQNGSVQVISDTATWEVNGGRKVVLQGKDTDHLIALQMLATERHIPCHSVMDAGLTQVEEGSLTVLALFGSDEVLDSLTGDLKLL